MTKRTRKMLSLLLAAAMVFSMNTFAFGGEKTVKASVDTDEISTPAQTASSNCYGWFAATDDAGAMAKCFLGWIDAKAAGEKEDPKHFDSEHYVTDGPITISENYGGNNGYAREAGYYGSNLVNYTGGWRDNDEKKIREFVPGDASFVDGVSSNVIKLDDTTYLLVAYKLDGYVGLNVGTNVPVVPFNGKKYDDVRKAPDDGKIDKNNSAIRVEAALVKQEAGKEPVIISNTASWNNAKKSKKELEVSIKPKNNIYANVSMNRLWDDKGNDLGYVKIDNPYLKGDAHPYFNISIKFNADKEDTELKDAKKLLKNGVDQYNEKLKKAEFKFDICQNSFANAYFDLVSTTNFKNADEDDKGYHYYGDFDHVGSPLGFRHVYPFPNFHDDDWYGTGKSLVQDGFGTDNATRGSWIGKRELYVDEIGRSMGSIDLFTDAKKAGKNGPSVYLINVTGDYERSLNASGWLKKKSFTTYKLKKDKDYEVKDLGDAGVALLPKGNFCPFTDGVIYRDATYTIPAGYGDYKKDTKVTELRVGIYNTKTNNYYVDSVD
ncbi:MAG: hypothetical protein IJP84_07490 [Lachnospiraceae bacterium]|nr:hypothetical protein [Lachnospiraceae bacterium]